MDYAYYLEDNPCHCRHKKYHTIPQSKKKNNLPLDKESYGYRFYKNLNEDVKLVSDEYGRWDIDFQYGKDDWVNVNGFDSLTNACIIAIMTRFTELDFMDLYSNFGCRIHELIKANKTKNVKYHIEIFISEVLEKMRRVKKVNWVRVTDSPNNQLYNYRVRFSITATLDDNTNTLTSDGKGLLVTHTTNHTSIVEGEFNI